MGLKHLQCFCGNTFLFIITRETGKMPLLILPCEEGPYSLIKCSRCLLVFSNKELSEVGFTSSSVLIKDERNRENASALQ